ncbi:tetratricopeptide repeat protein [Microvirga guangxiensis]|uniref:Tetratricopeptide repeat-containing protein n=1 Tax=Microvirga guangxiensis TaxID=549386 RepID=A0A1G5GWF9_9HYPH|nr:tetratricopeptide repeat protein [Microvirga guangxiensis]SCY55886.1 Tetratricopeptide repeat-containing protein [Microvirga guangxiensis]
MRLASSAITIAVLVLGFAAIAQQVGPGSDQPPSSAPNPPPSTPPSANQPQVDESALRYFASQGDTRRVNAEIARLRALYPNWTPPSDLSQLSSGPAVAVDPIIERLWNLYKEDRIAEVRAAIAERQSTDPNWKPPEELVTALDTVEARRRLTNASDSSQWRTVLTVATENPNLLTCVNVDVLWRVAEAFAKTDQTSRSRDVYTYLLTNCGNPGERLATLQKALTILPENQVADLLQFERKTGETPDNFDSIREELARRRVERASNDDKTTATAEDLAVVERMIRNTNEPGPVLVLAWYNYHHGNPARGLELFKTALDRNGGNKAAEGYAMSLRALERIAEAEAFAYDWRDKAPENMKVYLDVATALLTQDPPPRLETRVVSRIVPVVSSQRFPDGAQALGWYSYNTSQFQTAREWFRLALEWRPEDEPSAYGLALSTQRLNDRAGFNAVVAQWRDRSERIADLADGATPARPGQPRAQVVQPAQTVPQAPMRSVPVQAEAPRVVVERSAVEVEPTMRVATAATGSTSGRRNCIMTRSADGMAPDAALTLGWCLMDANRPMEAVNAFDQAIRRGSSRIREEAAYGKSLAYLRKNLTSEAAVAAAQAPQTSQRRVELSASILGQRALAAYRDGRYVETILALSERARIVPEQNDLMLIRGWSYYKLGRYKDAERIFRAVQRTGFSEEASVGLNAVLEASIPNRQ